MEKTRNDKIQDIALTIIKPLVYVWMFLDAKRTVKVKGDLSFKRKEPFVMVANHTFLFDVVHVPLWFKVVPFIVASQDLFTKQPTKFLLTRIAHVIPKSKGESDLRTARDLIGAVRRGYPILIFPEGNTTFCGETTHIEYSTMKLIKKLGVDVVTCNVKGGHLSNPRWATGKRKNRRIELNYEISIKKEELSNLSVDEVSVIINHALYNHDYDYQREKMIKHPSKKMAEGLENILYICPSCEGVNTMETKGNTLSCHQCNTTGYVDEYGFIQGFEFDNTVAWDHFQKQYRDLLRESVIESTGVLYFISFEDSTREYIGDISIVYKNNTFVLDGALSEIIKLEDITNPIITLRRDFAFVYRKKYYYIKLDRFASSLLRVSQDKY
ncbi:MAG: 1-acyl-sn-glycerol-3-phosphate acyltransferase [Firmicutes bacterium]|nr:1-acyl-sn-glycerol-3-phosphate acyltransferase [Bacillota bacterium]